MPKSGNIPIGPFSYADLITLLSMNYDDMMLARILLRDKCLIFNESINLVEGKFTKEKEVFNA
jgi:hypothetical protein